MDALNTPLIDLCYIFQAILLGRGIYWRMKGRTQEEEEEEKKWGGDKRGSGQLMGLNLTPWCTVQHQVTTAVGLLSVCLRVCCWIDFLCDDSSSQAGTKASTTTHPHLLSSLFPTHTHTHICHITTTDPATHTYSVHHSHFWKCQPMVLCSGLGVQWKALFVLLPHIPPILDTVTVLPNHLHGSFFL